MVIRKGNSEDMFSIRDILLKMHSETTLSVPSIDMEKLTYHILYTLKHGYVFVAVLKNKVIGTIGGLATSDWWSEEKHLADLWFYVSPDNRKCFPKRWMSMKKSLVWTWSTSMTFSSHI